MCIDLKRVSTNLHCSLVMAQQQSSWLLKKKRFLSSSSPKKSENSRIWKISHARVLRFQELLESLSDDKSLLTNSLLLASYQHFVFKGLMNSRTKEDCIIIHTYNIKESEATIHTSIEYICLSPLMFLLATFPRVVKKKRKKFWPKSKKLIPHLSEITRSMGHTTRETYKRER